MKFFKTIRDTLIITVIIIIVIPLLLAFSPVVAFMLIKNHYDEKAYKKAYKQYLVKINDTNFFCYNNKQPIQTFIEQQVLPLLDTNINIIFLDGKIPFSNFNKSYISTALYGIKDKKGFPYLLKIRDGVVVDKSINADLYFAINHNENMNSLVEKVDLFFED